MNRYKIVEKNKPHDSYLNYIIIDKEKGETICCECYDIDQANKICTILNATNDISRLLND